MKCNSQRAVWQRTELEGTALTWVGAKVSENQNTWCEIYGLDCHCFWICGEAATLIYKIIV